MSTGWINLLVLVAAVAVIAGAIAITWFAATRPAGRKAPGTANPSRASRRKVNPKTGDLFP